MANERDDELSADGVKPGEAAPPPLVRGWQGVYPKEKFANVFVIGLAGFAQSGKTTVAEAVLAEIGRQTPLKSVRLSFATRIKAVLAAMVGGRHSFRSLAEKSVLVYGDGDWTVRDFLLAFGTEFIREQLGQNFWIDVMADELAGFGEPTVAVIDDVRLPREVALVKPLGLSILIERSGVERKIEHSTEHPERLAVDAKIKNDGTPAEAAAAILELARAHADWPR